jgi:hypothetical protein
MGQIGEKTYGFRFLILNIVLYYPMINTYIYPRKELAANHPELRKTGSIWEEVVVGYMTRAYEKTPEGETLLAFNDNLPTYAEAKRWCATWEKRGKTK